MVTRALRLHLQSTRACAHTHPHPHPHPQSTAKPQKRARTPLFACMSPMQGHTSCQCHDLGRASFLCAKTFRANSVDRSLDQERTINKMYGVSCLGTPSYSSQGGIFSVVRRSYPGDLIKVSYLSVAQPPVRSESKECVQVGIIPQAVHRLNRCGWLQQMAADPRK